MQILKGWTKICEHTCTFPRTSPPIQHPQKIKLQSYEPSDTSQASQIEGNSLSLSEIASSAHERRGGALQATWLWFKIELTRPMEFFPGLKGGGNTGHTDLEKRINRPDKIIKNLDLVSWYNIHRTLKIHISQKCDFVMEKNAY